MNTDGEDDDPLVEDSPAADWDGPAWPPLEKAGQLSLRRTLLATVAAAVACSWFWPGSAYWSGNVKVGRGEFLRGGGRIRLCTGDRKSSRAVRAIPQSYSAQPRDPNETLIQASPPVAGPRSRSYRLTLLEIVAVDLGVLFLLVAIVFSDQIVGLVWADLRRPRYSQHRRR